MSPLSNAYPNLLKQASFTLLKERVIPKPGQSAQVKAFLNTLTWGADGRIDWTDKTGAEARKLSSDDVGGLLDEIVPKIAVHARKVLAELPGYHVPVYRGYRVPADEPAKHVSLLKEVLLLLAPFDQDIVWLAREIPVICTRENDAYIRAGFDVDVPTGLLPLIVSRAMDEEGPEADAVMGAISRDGTGKQAKDRPLVPVIMLCLLRSRNPKAHARFEAMAGKAKKALNEEMLIAADKLGVAGYAKLLALAHKLGMPGPAQKMEIMRHFLSVGFQNPHKALVEELYEQFAVMVAQPDTADKAIDLAATCENSTDRSAGPQRLFCQAALAVAVIGMQSHERQMGAIQRLLKAPHAEARMTGIRLLSRRYRAEYLMHGATSWLIDPSPEVAWTAAKYVSDSAVHNHYSSAKQMPAPGPEGEKAAGLIRRLRDGLDHLYSTCIYPTEEGLSWVGIPWGDVGIHSGSAYELYEKWNKGRPVEELEALMERCPSDRRDGWVARLLTLFPKANRFDAYVIEHVVASEDRNLHYIMADRLKVMPLCAKQAIDLVTRASTASGSQFRLAEPMAKMETEELRQVLEHLMTTPKKRTYLDMAATIVFVVVDSQKRDKEKVQMAREYGSRIVEKNPKSASYLKGCTLPGSGKAAGK